MILRLRILVFALTLPFLSAFAQKSKKTDKIILVNLETHIRYLSDDKLEGGVTGTPGEKTASDYISSAFSQAGLQPKGDHNGWLQTFEINEGRQVSSDSYFSVNDRQFLQGKEYFPLTISAVGTLSGSPAIALQESGVPWFLDLKELLDNNTGNSSSETHAAAHTANAATLSAAIRTRAKECAKKGATALILYNSSKTADNLVYDPRNRPEPAAIPIIYITKEAKRKYLKDESASLDIKLRVGFTEKHRTGHNIIGYLDNGAPNTIVIGTPYSGYTEGGEDSSSLHRSGANDYASGVAAVIELARMLKESRLRGNNYLFVAFSGEARGLYGSAYFIEHAPVDLSNVNYMLDLDRVGRLSDSSHLLTVGGVGSSPSWGGVCNKVVDKKLLTLHPDNDGAGSGDHLSFYHRNIPVLFFLPVTGSPAQDKINYDGELHVLKFVYDIVQTTNSMGRMAFTTNNMGRMAIHKTNPIIKFNR